MDSIDDLRAAAQAALDRRDITAALSTFTQLAAAFPANKMAVLEAAQGLMVCGAPNAAAAALETALVHAPRSVGLLDALAAAYLKMGVPHKAAGAVERMARVFEADAAASPQDPARWVHLGLTRMRLGQWAAAAASLNTAARLQPGSVAILLSLAQAEKAAGRRSAAESVFRRVLALEPGNAPAQAFLAETAAQPTTAIAVLLDQAATADRRGLFAVAREMYEAVLRQEPDHVYALSRLLSIDGIEGRLDDAEARHEMLVESLARVDLAALLAPYLAIIALQDVNRPLPRPLYTAVTRALDRQLTATPKATLPKAEDIAPAARRLKIGYLSGLFRDHPVGHVTAALFAAHDRARVDVHVFYRSEITKPNPYTETIKKGAEHFITLEGSPREMADTIAAHGLDILLFIGGYSEFEFLETVAARPAPIQIFWLGHAGNCDISAIDYVLADATVLPPDEENLYTAKVVRLPTVYHCASPHRIGDPLTRAAAGLPEEGFVFCAFNHTEKIDREVFEVWMNILRRVAGSVLWLSWGLSPAVEDNLRLAAAAQGVDGARLVFATRLPDKAQHLARHRLCGLMLDTFLINAHTTALDALWSGLPLLTVAGARFGSRFGMTVLRTLGLEDMIMPTRTAYEDRAVHLASHPFELEEIRGRLAASLYTSPLFQTDVFCRGLEDTLEGIHHFKSAISPA